jgi:CubicO group peptidase (beta-lactamase class C family)
MEKHEVECKPDGEGNVCRAAVKGLLEKGIAGGNHKGGFALYGNLKDDTREFVGVGASNRQGSPYDKSTIIRFASQSKLLGGICLAKALEEGIIKLSDPIYKYYPAFAANFSYYNQDGTVTDTFDGKTILVSNLLSMSTGLGYYFTNWGNLYPLMTGTGPFPTQTSVANTNRNALIKSKLATNPNGLFWDWQFDPRINKAYWDNPTGFQLATMCDYIEFLLGNIPFLFKPGTNSLRDTCYGMDYDFLGAVLNKAIQAKNPKSNTWKYMKEKFLEPMHIKSFFQIGNADRPKCLRKKLAETEFRRPVGNTLPKYPLVEFAPDESPEYKATKEGQLVWASEFPNDGFYYNETLFTKVFIKNDPCNGYFGAGWGGTPYDYSKFFELIFGRGMFRGQRIISEVALKLVTTSSLPEFDSFWLLSVNKPPNPSSTEANPVAQVEPYTNFLSQLSGLPTGLGDKPLAFGYNETWCAGVVRGNRSFYDALYANDGSFTETSIRWGSYYGTNYFLDTETGNYVMAGVQRDANSYPSNSPTDNADNWATIIFKWLQYGNCNLDDCNRVSNNCHLY